MKKNVYSILWTLIFFHHTDNDKSSSPLWCLTLTKYDPKPLNSPTFRQKSTWMSLSFTNIWEHRSYRRSPAGSCRVCQYARLYARRTAPQRHMMAASPTFSQMAFPCFLASLKLLVRHQSGLSLAGLLVDSPMSALPERSPECARATGTSSSRWRRRGEPWHWPWCRKRKQDRVRCGVKELLVLLKKFESLWSRWSTSLYLHQLLLSSGSPWNINNNCDTVQHLFISAWPQEEADQITRSKVKCGICVL